MKNTGLETALLQSGQPETSGRDQPCRAPSTFSRLLGARILIANGTRRRVGGTEDYLASIIPELHLAGYKLALVSEFDSQIERKPIELPDGVPEWCIANLGAAETLSKSRSWKPDLIYVHGALQVDFERHLLNTAPAIYFAHNYFGTCISGHKAHRWPTPRPCHRTLGWQCLIHYLPRRCGGRSPLTMLTRYRTEKKRLDNILLYSAIVTHSEHMRQEYIHHGLSPARVFNFAYEAGSSQSPREDFSPLVNIVSTNNRLAQTAERPHRLLYLGRMEKLKGGGTLIDAVPLIQAMTRMPIQVTFAGDGPELRHLRQQARRTEDKLPSTSFLFTGWLSSEQVSWQLQNADVLVVPSLWPEPFGRVGIQAGHNGLPVAAFSVGGIPEWLKDGVNGRLAPGDPPTPEGLATAIVGCLDESAAPALRKGARELATRFSTQQHLQRLLTIFESTLTERS